MTDDWAQWEEENCWKAEDDWRKREQETRDEASREFYRRMFERYRRGDKEGDEPARE